MRVMPFMMMSESVFVKMSLNLLVNNSFHKPWTVVFVLPDKNTLYG